MPSRAEAEWALNHAIPRFAVDGSVQEPAAYELLEKLHRLMPNAPPEPPVDPKKNRHAQPPARAPRPAQSPPPAPKKRLVGRDDACWAATPETEAAFVKSIGGLTFEQARDCSRDHRRDHHRDKLPRASPK